MPDRLEVTKTYKLYIDGKFPRSESGRSVAATDAGGRVFAHCCRASRKDLRDAVSAARKAQPGWRDATAYLRAQIMYRMAEMLEGKRDEFVRALSEAGAKTNVRASSKVGKSKDPLAYARGWLKPEAEVAASIDRLVAFAGWADKYAQVLGCNNAVAGPYYNFTVPEPTGVVGVLAPDEPALLGLISLVAPPLCAGNTIVALGGQSAAGLLVTSIFAEVVATSDVPGGVVNLLTGDRAELIPFFSSHRDIDALHAISGPGGVSAEQAAVLRAGAAENLKRVSVREMASGAKAGKNSGALGQAQGHAGIELLDARTCQSPWWIESFVEMKTIWHPSAT